MNIFEESWIINRVLTRKELEILIITMNSCGIESKWVSNQYLEEFPYCSKRDDVWTMTKGYIKFRRKIGYRTVMIQLRRKIKENEHI